MKQVNPFEPKYLENYDNWEEVSKAFPSLSHLEQPIDPAGTFFIIRAPTKDNVHRAIKYGIWTSSSRNNQKLNDAPQPVYLIFNVTSTSNFVGMAKLLTTFREKDHFKYWNEELKWFGSFQIEWIFVRDVPYANLTHIEQSCGKCLHELIDCQPIENGQLVYEIFKKAPQNSCLIKSFLDLDITEKKRRNDRDNSQQFNNQFTQYTEVFESMPFKFSVNSYQRRKQQEIQQQYYWSQYYQTPWQGMAQPGFWKNTNQDKQQQMQKYPGFYQNPNSHKYQQQQQYIPQHQQQNQQQEHQKPKERKHLHLVNSNPQKQEQQQ